MNYAEFNTLNSIINTADSNKIDAHVSINKNSITITMRYEKSIIVTKNLRRNSYKHQGN